MPTNNPSGANGFDHFAQEPAYGQRTEEARQAAASPVPANPALGAPKQDQRRAVRGEAAPAPTAPETPPAPGPSGAPPIIVAQAWAEIAAVPGASPLVKQIAAEAQNVRQ